MVDVLDLLLRWWVCFISFSLLSACILRMLPTSINVCMKHYVTIIHSESKSGGEMRWRQVYQTYHSMSKISFDIRKRYKKFNGPAVLSYQHQYQITWTDNVKPHKFARKCQDRSKSGLKEWSYTTFTLESVHPIWNQIPSHFLNHAGFVPKHCQKT